MKVMTFNMKQFAGWFLQGGRTKVAEFINNKGIDICLLQEGYRCFFFGTIERLARQTGMEVRSVKMHGGICNNWQLGVLSNPPIIDHREREFDTGDNWRRSALICKLQNNILVATVHLGYDVDDQNWQVTQLLWFLDEFKHDGVIIVGGDFNIVETHRAYYTMRAAGFVDAWKEAGTGNGNTYKNKRIDYLWVKRAKVTSCTVARIEASDHEPVVLELN